MWSWRRRRGSTLILGILREIARREPGVEAHVDVMFPQDPIADAGRHGRGASVKATARAGPRAMVGKGHGRAEEVGEFSRRALVHALQRHGEVEPVEDTLRDLGVTPRFADARVSLAATLASVTA